MFRWAGRDALSNVSGPGGICTKLGSIPEFPNVAINLAAVSAAIGLIYVYAYVGLTQTWPEI